MELDLNYREHFKEVHKNGKKKEGPPCDTDWENARIVVEFVQTFFETTMKSSGSPSVISNLYFPEVCEIQDELTLSTNDENKERLVARMAVGMKTKFEKYWGDPREANAILIISHVLDPRYKLKFVKMCYDYFYGVFDSARLVNHVESTLRRLFDHYNEVCFGVTPTCANLLTASSGSSNVLTRPGKIMSKFIAKKLEVASGMFKNEVDKYLSEKTEDLVDGEHFDILAWWQVNSSKYKVLSLIARDVLAVPVTAVPSEAAFSMGDCILDPFSSSLSPKMVEALICLKSWFEWKQSTCCGERLHG